jgi:hypothetical protein
MALFIAVVLLTFFASSLAGHVAVEKARREGLRALERAKEARKAEVVLRNRVDLLTGIRSVETWSAANGFAPAVAAQQTKTLVASNQ